MCGIVGYIGGRDCGQFLLDGLRRLEYRGYDSAGIALVHEGQVALRRAEGKLHNLEAAYFAERIPGKLGIAHTRWATHGAPNERNAHPHRSGSVVVVHNGIIENHIDLKRRLIESGRTFASETDTEIIAHLVDEALAEVGDGGGLHPLHAAVRRMLEQIEGAYAILVISERFPDVLVAARKASPLVLGLGEEEMYAASDIPAVLMHTRRFIFMEDDETAVLRGDGIELFDGACERVEREAKWINWDPVSAEKQGYKHFMLKEIHEQPAKITDTLRGRVSLERGDVDLAEIGLDEAYVGRLDHIQIIACGTSYHAGWVGRYLIEKMARVHTSVDLASEFRYSDPVIDDRTLVIAISQSGETADTLAALHQARGLGARVVSICNVLESSIPRASDGVLYTHAGPEIGVASTKAFTTQLAALFMFSVWLGRRRGRLDEAGARELLTELRKVPQLLEGLLEQEAVYHEIAREFSQAHSFLFLGRGINFPVALEGALKLKEISYIHAEGYAAGEMKHGPIALIDEDLPIVIVAPRSETYEKVFSNLEEVRARGGRVIAVATEGDDRIGDYADVVLSVPDVPEALQPLVNTVPLQLLAYHIADFKGTDVDQPRNLAKSVTVE
ncbi:MAG: glutamine--fructose-6-phosphate transaminase (isomerizing) [Myxococcales bacterium]|nr:glutamine--fructose-6-phosphate transaminase (isomerizing) [Myxococcales bacterium]